MTDADIKEFNTKLGTQLKEYRLSKHVSQTMIAEECNTTKSSISRIEKGHKSADIGVLQAYSKVLNIPLSTLVKIEDLEVGPELNVVTCLLSMSYKNRRIAYRMIYDIWDLDLSIKSKGNYKMAEHSNTVFSINKEVSSTSYVDEAAVPYHSSKIRTNEQPKQNTTASESNYYIPAATLRGILLNEAVNSGEHPADILLKKDLKLMQKKHSISDSDHSLGESEE